MRGVLFQLVIYPDETAKQQILPIVGSMTFDYSRLAATCGVESPENAVTLPPEAYGSDELYTAEVDRVFKRGWIPLCRVEQHVACRVGRAGAGGTS